ncbi:hypothetical protein GS580_27640 [Rhodococcus hoagii]|nr:hypothetical protein [Prescottella equi]
MIGVVAMFAAIAGCAMTDPIERIRYDDPDAPKLSRIRSGQTRRPWDRARDARIA